MNCWSSSLHHLSKRIIYPGGWGWLCVQYLFRCCIQTFVPLASLCVHVQSRHDIHTHQLTARRQSQQTHFSVSLTITKSNVNFQKSREAVSVSFRLVSLPAQCEDFPRSVSPGSHSFEWMNDGPIRLKPTAQYWINIIARVPWINLIQSVTECVVVLTESTLPWFLRCSLYFWSTYSSYLPKIRVMTYRAGKNYR